MPLFRPVAELFAEIDAAKTVAEKSDFTMQLAQALISNLWMFDLKNILSHRFVPSEALDQNFDEVVELFKSPQDLMLAFGTTLHFVPVKSGYKFELSNNHHLNEIETLLISQGSEANVLIPLHNLFLSLEGRELVYLDSKNTDAVKRFEQLMGFPYFKLSQAETHHNHKVIHFTRPDLLAKLNELLARPDFHLGKTMFDFLEKGKHGEAFSEKVFKNYKEKLALTA